MLKVCPRCTSTYGGGRRCVACGAILLDMADPPARPVAASRGVYRRIKAFYAARRGMIVLFAGSLAALAAAIVLLRFARTSDGATSSAWYVATALAPVVLGLATAWASARLSRAWKERSRARTRLAPGVAEPPPPPGDEKYI
jgi:hypothetical protein